MFDRTKHQKNVDAFMILAQQMLPGKPTIPDEKTRELRARLILEEALEAVEALGFKPRVEDERGLVTLAIDAIEFYPNEGPNLAQIIDGCCDIKVVTTGTLSACGIPDDAFQELVDQNNLAKFGPGGYRREDGKWVKPPGHQPPDIDGMLKTLEEKP